jgi:hypothetical protein
MPCTDGLTGTSPKKRCPEPKISGDLTKIVATHAAVCQVEYGELKGRDYDRLIGASIVGTEQLRIPSTKF